VLYRGAGSDCCCCAGGIGFSVVAGDEARPRAMKYIKATIAISATTEITVVKVEFSVLTPAGVVVAISTFSVLLYLTPSPHSRPMVAASPG
jgi:hypothetical protein